MGCILNSIQMFKYQFCYDLDCCTSAHGKYRTPRNKKSKPPCPCAHQHPSDANLTQPDRHPLRCLQGYSRRCRHSYDARGHTCITYAMVDGEHFIPCTRRTPLAMMSPSCLPEDGVFLPAKRSSNVVFPEPEGPVRPRINRRINE